ncbi:MAG: hypothetical protein AAFY06_05955 [Pseudomonadota bacterium]
MKKQTAIILVAMLGLTACSTGSDIERAAVGALGGCVIGDALDEGNCIRGAVVGAGVGALSDDVNLF